MRVCVMYTGDRLPYLSRKTGIAPMRGFMFNVSPSGVCPDSARPKTAPAPWRK